LWEFLVTPAKRAEFEQAYAADGPWAELFGRVDGCTGIQLLRCTEQDGRYLPVDRWRWHRAGLVARGRRACRRRDQGCWAASSA
jgi:heme-degrading monooxygenase HmoA